jgi:hypothetical protein
MCRASLPRTRRRVGTLSSIRRSSGRRGLAPLDQIHLDRMASARTRHEEGTQRVDESRWEDRGRQPGSLMVRT